MSSGPDTTRNQMLQMPFDCAQRVRWNEERQATIRQWIDKYNHLVRAKYRYRLRCFPQEVDDGVQDFWMWFLIDAMELVYDPAIAKPEAYIQMLANRRAINYLRAIW